jgi:hypothetical protein
MPNYGLGFQVEVLEPFPVTPFSPLRGHGRHVSFQALFFSFSSS